MAASTDDVDWQALVVDDVGAQLEEKEISAIKRMYTTWYMSRLINRLWVRSGMRRFLTVSRQFLMSDGRSSRRLIDLPFGTATDPPPLVRENFARMGGLRPGPWEQINPIDAIEQETLRALQPRIVNNPRIVNDLPPHILRALQL